MRFLIFLLFIVSNAAWLFACVALSYQPESLQNFLSRFGIQTSFALQTFIPHALAVAILLQLLLLIMYYFLTIHGSFLKLKVQKESQKNKELITKSQRREEILRNKIEELDEKTGTAQEAQVLKERVNGMQQLLDELRNQNKLLEEDNVGMGKELQKNQNTNSKAKTGDSFWQRVTSFFKDKSKN